MIGRFAAARLHVLTGAAILIGMGGGLNLPSDPLHAGLDGWLTPALAAEPSATTANFADVVDKVKPAVIGVRVKTEVVGQLPAPPGLPPGRSTPRRRGTPRGEPDTPFDLFPGQPNRQQEQQREGAASQGSGFFVDPDGYAVTTHHVTENSKTIEISTDDGKSYSAKLVGSDPSTDLALLKVEGTGFPFVRLADKPPRVGDWVLAIGNPFGLGGTVTAGIISGRARDIGVGTLNDFLQIDAPVNQGNSGGPAFDLNGDVVGVNSAIFTPTGGSVGIGFAIPAETVGPVVAQLKDKGKVIRGWLGVQIQPVNLEIAENLGLKQAQGVLVAQQQTNSPAAKAGIVSGDVITSVNDEPIEDSRDLIKKISGMAPGTPVKLGIFRKGENKAVTVTLGELPNSGKSGGDVTAPN
ncbi:MAG TPA: trypsin-like peptidase domain-containing protein [Xanthobacteraceae bacterium]|nr:trypsin-like peptidase domain-containing protein [Xanthobacteraceae bacterium]